MGKLGSEGSGRVREICPDLRVRIKCFFWILCDIYGSVMCDFSLSVSSRSLLKSADWFYISSSGRKWGFGEDKKLSRNQKCPWFCASSSHERSLVNDCTKHHAVAVTANPPAPCNVSWQHLKCRSVGYCGCYADLNRFNEQLWSHYWKPVFRDEACNVAVWLLTVQIRIEMCSNLEYLLNTEKGKRATEVL